MRSIVFCLLVACGSSKDEGWQPIGSAPPPSDAAVPIDAGVDAWASCEKTLKRVMTEPANRRVAALIDGCRPCGDWQPLLAWDTQEVDGGPTRAAIEQAMLACKAYCTPNAKQRFLGTLDAARGKGTRGPWRHLGELCKGEVSAAQDARFMSAPYFALDRIARAVAARPALAPQLAAIELALPALASSGSGLDLARSPSTSPAVPLLALTVTAVEFRIAQRPRGKLGEAGVALVATGEPYPGAPVKTAKELDAAVSALGGGDAIAVFAPHGMLATRLLDAIALAGKRDVRLAVAANGGPPGWPVAGTLPVALVTQPDPKAIRLALDDDPDPAIKDVKARSATLKGPVTIQIGPKTTVGAFAKLTGALYYFDIKQVAVVRGK